MKESGENLAGKPGSLTLFQSLTYSLGTLGANLITQTIVLWAIYYYAPAEERGLTIYATIAALGFAMAFGRIIDSIADPLVGYWSDKTKSKYGRRIPFVLFGNLPLVLFFIALWYPPVAQKSMINALYFALILGAFFFFYTIVVAPYLSLLPEIAKSKDERINLVTYQAYFLVLGLLIAFLGSGILIQKFGFKIMGIIMGITALISFYISIAFIKETPHSKAKEIDLSFTQCLIYSFKNKPFLYYLCCIGFFWLGFNIALISMPYMVVVIMKSTEEWVGYSSGILLLVSVLFFPLVNFLARKYGKRIVFLGAIFLLSIILPLVLLIGKIPLATPFYQGLFYAAIIGIPVAGLLLLPYAILADVIDYDEKRTGLRREAMYMGVQGLITKGAIAFASVIATQILSRFGNTFDKPFGIYLCGPVGSLLTLIGFIIFLRYPFRE